MGPTPGLMEMRVIAEHLEGVLAREVASAVVFEALEPFGGEMPRGEALREMVLGPLCSLLAARVGDDHAFELTQQIVLVLGLGSAPPVARPTGADGGPRDRMRRSDFPTAELSVSSGAVTVVVVAAGVGLERRLFAALGPGVRCVPLRRADKLSDAVRQLSPHLVLVDATDPAGDPDGVVAGVGEVASAVVTVLWASDQPWGRAVAERLGEGSRVALLPRHEGVEPLLDLVRSRMLQV